ncbi:MerR family transcriptional regulator [Paenibacillus sp. TH7-28]
MLINEACKRSNLTKKAVEYYEAKGLISPEILENGYRDYSEADILTLKEISVLRKCGISVTDIKIYCVAKINPLHWQGVSMLRKLGCNGFKRFSNVWKI